MNHFHHRKYLLAISILVLLVSFPLPANASGTTNNSIVSFSAVANILATPSVLAPQPLLVMGPYGYTCYGQTDYPHNSGHVPGTANVEARTICPGTSVSVSTTLYRERWYGLENLGQQSNSGFGSAAVNVSWVCSGSGTYTYDAYSTHTATGYSNSPLYTSSTARFTC